MPRKRYWCGIVLFSSFSASAGDVSPETTNDARCFLVAVSMSQRDFKAQAMASYYLGRLDGRAPGIDLERLVLEVYRTIRPSEVATEAQRCSQVMQDRGRVIVSIGEKLAHATDIQSSK
jgi:hypothetical protein